MRLKRLRAFFLVLVLSCSFFATAQTESSFDSSLVLNLSVVNGQVVDLGPNRFKVLTNGGAASMANRHGQPNSAILLNGVDQNIEIPCDPRLSPDEFTWSAWVNFQDLDSTIQLWTMGPGGFERWRGGGIQLGAKQYLNYADFTGSDYNANLRVRISYFVTNQWYQIVVTRSGNSCAIYVNGVELDSQTGLTPYIKTQSGSWILGANGLPGTDSFYLYGRMILDTVQLYGTALSAGQVAELYSTREVPAVIVQKAGNNPPIASNGQPPLSPALVYAIKQASASQVAPFTNEAAAVLSLQKAVYVTTTNLFAGSNYQLQVSPDLITWTNAGTVFTATNSCWQSDEYWNVNNWNQLFFRLLMIQ